MGLFDQWNAARDAVNGHAEKAGDEDEAEFKRLCYRMDDLMVQIAVLPATDARDFAAKLSSLTHYGVYDELAGDVWGLGSALIREAAELIGHPEHVVEAHREPASLKANLAPNQSQKAA
jgi:hypothetical protein